MFNGNEERAAARQALLFEVLMEFKNFTLLTRVQRINIGVPSRYDAATHTSYIVRVGLEQFEHLCLVNEEGMVAEVLRVNEFERRKFSMASQLKPYLNKQVLEKYLGDDWNEVHRLPSSGIDLPVARHQRIEGKIFIKDVSDLSQIMEWRREVRVWRHRIE